ncbi:MULTISPECIES: hypothetical protein [Brevibacillus]|jgi:hypothetical protein|uniref:hypothetical protein n=1 Tax=Brevibacillus TaxID=55080 RepID=UPI00287F6D3E|nr:hypothetical protein [Brevibacillus borstelensis]WNF05325.1 hypothetical protein RFB14_23755 [Brevibacillus borstelensis]
MMPVMKKQAVVIWESDVRQQDRSVIPFPTRERSRGTVEQEATVTSWTVGPKENPATVTIVSSGFEAAERKQAAPQAMLGRRAAA